ncbi:hypothetical protein EHI42_24235 [Rhizobium hidalgonense]|uniref:hypothetical protein n=1 Tax=Rhizobium hidalgonense TaxID=1538159 RepID=UPI000FEC5690|nr:hypothetical protein [Rhizobium hidalgonense]RWX11385.1 hypothetical protein EHI42_24235 [Rhizobium hidalgonense]
MLLDAPELIFQLAFVADRFGIPHIPSVNEHCFCQTTELARGLEAPQYFRKSVLDLVTRD